MEKPLLRIIQLSDLHLYADIRKSLVGVNTEDSFLAVIDLVKKNNDVIDLILVSGDLSQDQSPASYTRMANHLKSFSVPVFIAPGNHDDIETMNRIYPLETISTDRHIIVDNWQFIILSSQKKGYNQGFIADEQFNFLRASLAGHPCHHTIVVFHHHPVPTRSSWLDEQKIPDEQLTMLWDILSDYPLAKTILFGHIHMVLETVVKGINCYSAPSTCFQFMPDRNDFSLDSLPPGYRWIEIYSNGHIKTGIHRIDHYIGEFQTGSDGYE